MSDRLGRNPFSSKVVPPSKAVTRKTTTWPGTARSKPVPSFSQESLVTLTRDLTRALGFIAIGLSASILAAIHRTWLTEKA